MHTCSYDRTVDLIHPYPSSFHKVYLPYSDPCLESYQGYTGGGGKDYPKFGQSWATSSLTKACLVIKCWPMCRQCAVWCLVYLEWLCKEVLEVICERGCLVILTLYSHRTDKLQTEESGSV